MTFLRAPGGRAIFRPGGGVIDKPVGGVASGFTNASMASIYSETPGDPTDITIPAWAVEDNYCYAFVNAEADGFAALPSGFTTDHTTWKYDSTTESVSGWKKLTAGDITAGVITCNNPGWHASSTVLLFAAGQHATSPIDISTIDSGFDGSGSGTTASIGSEILSQDNCLVAYFVGFYSSGTISATPTVDGSAETTTYDDTWGGYVIQTTAAATGAQAPYFSANYSRWQTLLLVLKPA